MFTRRVVIAFLAPVIFAFMVSSSTAFEAPKKKRVTPMNKVVQGNNAFGLVLYHNLRTEDKGNLFLSPYSISTALAMTYAGAKGKTATEMAEVLRFTVPQEQLSPAFAALASKLHGDTTKKGYQLKIANRLWGQTGYHFLPAFLRVTREDYHAELAQVDFAHDVEAARRTINAWIEDKTDKKIKNLIAKGVLDPLTTLVLTNAIYFKSEWKNQFEASATKDAFFLVTPQKKVTVPMMYQRANFAYGDVDNAQVLELPYAGKDLSMVILLPKQVDGLADLEQKLTLENLNAWTSHLRKQNIKVYLPKFTMTSSFRLEQVLSSMGMPQAFSGEADFSGMDGSDNLFISAVIHKAFVDVDEKGTEAAAATAVVVERAAPFSESLIFRADHPFLFLIRDNRTGSILFLGRIKNPKE